MTLKKAKVAEDNWAGHKEVFLSFCDVKGTAKLNFFSLHKMKQGPRIMDHMDRIKDSVDVHEQVNALEKVDFAGNIVLDIQKECRRTACVMQDFYEKMIFFARLNRDVQVKVMEATPKLAYDALKVPIATETLILDKKDNLKMPIKLSAVKADKSENQELEEEDDKEEAALNSLNAIRIQRGKVPFKRFLGSYQKPNGNRAHNRA